MPITAPQTIGAGNQFNPNQLATLSQGPGTFANAFSNQVQNAEQVQQNSGLNPQQFTALQNDPAFRQQWVQNQRDIARPGQSATPYANAFTQQVQDAELGQSLQDQFAINQGLPGGVPATGLIGTEVALNEGLEQGTDVIREGEFIARGDVTEATQSAQDLLRDAGGQVNQQIGQGVGGLDPFVAPGQNAQQLQADFSGANGAEAQARAFANYQSSPGQKFAQEQAERATRRYASMIGGVDGGNVRRELQRQAIGMAQQDFQNQFQNLGNVSDRGLSAASNVGQLRGHQAGITSQLGQAGAGIGERSGISLADISTGAARDEGSLISSTANQQAGFRTRAGEAIAGGIDTTSQGLADLSRSLGLDLSSITDAGGLSLSNIFASAGGISGDSLSQLATLLATLAQNESGQNAGLGGIPGTQQTPGILDQLGSAASGAGTFISAVAPA
jgi:hypothetical protein